MVIVPIIALKQFNNSGAIKSIIKLIHFENIWNELNILL